MTPKKVLIITYYWPPSGGSGVQRWVKFCKYLPEFDIQPIVLTVKNATYPVIDETLKDEISDDLEVYHSKSFEPYKLFGKLTGRSDKEVSSPTTAFSTEGSWIKKIGVWIRSNFFVPDARIGWIPDTYKKARKIITEESIDTIITTGPPNSTHLIGKRLKDRNSDLKWIMDMRDPWSQIFYNETLPRTTLAQKFDLFLEERSLKTADEVVVVSSGMSKLQNSIVERSYHVITNGFDHTDFPSMIIPDKNEKFVIKYIGSMTESAIPHNLFQALSSISDTGLKKIELQFFGSYSEKIHQYIDTYGLGELIRFKGYVPHMQAKSEMQKANLLVLVIPNTKNNKIILPGKLFDYIGSQTPILMIGPKDGDAASVIKTYGLGKTFEFNETESLRSFLLNSIKGTQIPYDRWKDELKKHPFSRYNLAKQIAHIVRN